MILFNSDFQWSCSTSQGSPAATQPVVSVESLSLIIHYIVIDAPS